jgi:hypothetical protein
MRRARPFLAITLWMTSLSVTGETKATMSPRRTVLPSKGKRVTTSPFLMEGDILKPLALNRNGAPLSRTARTSSTRSGPQSANSSPFLTKVDDSGLGAFNNHIPVEALFYEALEASHHVAAMSVHETLFPLVWTDLEMNDEVGFSQSSEDPQQGSIGTCPSVCGPHTPTKRI